VVFEISQSDDQFAAIYEPVVSESPSIGR